MFHGLVHELVLEHSSFSSQAGSFLTAEVHLEKFTAAWIPLTYSACKPFLGYYAQSWFFLPASC